MQTKTTLKTQMRPMAQCPSCVHGEIPLHNVKKEEVTYEFCGYCNVCVALRGSPLDPEYSIIAEPDHPDWRPYYLWVVSDHEDKQVHLVVKTNMHHRRNAESMSFYINENTCPINWLRGDIQAIGNRGSLDPHGLFLLAGAMSVTEANILIAQSDSVSKEDKDRWLSGNWGRKQWPVVFPNFGKDIDIIHPTEFSDKELFAVSENPKLIIHYLKDEEREYDLDEITVINKIE